MLRTFRVNDVCKFPNAELYEQAIEYARSKGVPVYSSQAKGHFRQWPNLKFNTEITGNCSPNPKQEITIWEFFQNCDNWKECGSKPSEGEYIRHGAKVKVRDGESGEWVNGCRFIYNDGNKCYPNLVVKKDKSTEWFQYCELDETPEQTERQTIKTKNHGKQRITKALYNCG